MVHQTKGGTRVKLLFILVALILISTGGLYLARNAIIKSSLERAGTETLGVPVEVGVVNFNIFEEALDLAHFRVANPTDFEEKFLLAVDQAGVRIEAAEILSDPAHLELLTLTGIDLSIEQRSNQSNFRKVLQNIDTLTDRGGSDGGRRLHFEEILLRDITIRASLKAMGVVQTHGELAVDELRITNLASDRGLTTHQLIALVVRTLLVTSIRMGGSLLPAGIVQNLSGSLSDIVDEEALGARIIAYSAGDAISVAGAPAQQVEEAVEDVQERGKDAVDKLIQDTFDKALSDSG